MNQPVSAHQPQASLRPSACPGLLRIVQAQDGGICRIKLAGGALWADQADAVADAAERFATGEIEVTNRGNLQIRGIGSDPSGLIERLLAAGLGPRDAAGDDVRNLMLSPTAGVDPQMLVDTRPLAEQLLQALETTPRFHQLSAKFAVQVDGGEALAMLEHPHDVWLSTVRLEGELWWVFGLAGCPANNAPVGAVPLVQGHALVLAVLNRFLDLATPEQARMRQLLAEHSPDDFVAGLGLSIRRDATVLHWRRSATVGNGYLGIYPQQQAGLSAVGGAAPLGRLTPHMLRGAAQLARERGDGSLRMTPWQSLLLPNIAHPHAAAINRELAQLGLLCSPDQPLARLVACTGSAGCAKAQAETKGDARLLATLLASGAPASVHLSGCPRSCAMAHVAPATLLAQNPGHYDLYLRDAAQPGFGSLRARNLTLKEAGALLDACSRSTLDD
ncbi:MULTISPECIES: precorrin-3B synthase [Pseudomonas]|uniref:Precorrin-3B synthase n=1 Tax=Pseudomonas sp. Hg7Tf TaxID=3236988 RepID=A0AB39I0B0_9PSED|nr:MULTISPECIES: precorrin-3B synthase [Pseudomonas]MDH2560106.1 precorrin-3B synthase [Pseudomonas sp. Hg5Tf]